jgi:malate dehydrogenase (oxaloacetate-decarboxylating)
MEGKAFLMKYLGGVDAVALCVNNRDKDGKPNPDKLIDFVKMIEPSFGAVNLEDISQPNCYKVLDSLREDCNIPVWHDDAQGTASVTLAGLINALKLANKKIDSVKAVLLGAGAANSTIASILLKAGMSGEDMVIFDKDGALDTDRKDFESDPLSYRQWDLCKQTNPKKIKDIETAMKGADVLIAVSKPGPDTVKPEWIKLMADKAIVFTCANPVPEIYPYAAKEAGAFITATGRGDFANQVNNSLGFPGILKGALIVRAKKITDNMAIRSAYSLADYAEKRGINPDNIIPTMSEAEVFPQEAADVAMQAIEDGVANLDLSFEQVFNIAKTDIEEARSVMNLLMKENYIKNPPEKLLEDTLNWTVNQFK